MVAPICPTCGTAARLTDGREIYPDRPNLADKPIWACTLCDDTYVGCHPGTEDPLGFPADAGLREARSLLHERMIAPLWRNADSTSGYGRMDEEAARVLRKAARNRVYGYLAERMGIDREACHPAQFTIEQCREAWKALNGVSYPEIRVWAQRHRKPAEQKKIA